MDIGENAYKWYKVSFFVESAPYVRKMVEIKDMETKGMITFPYDNPFSWLKKTIKLLSERGIIIKGVNKTWECYYLLSSDFTKGL